MGEMRKLAMIYYAKMSNDQKQSALSLYKQIDTNGDGKVTIQEFFEPTGIFGLNGGVEYSYPEHPDRDDCINYLTTGFCSYGTRCGFNHPRDRASSNSAAASSSQKLEEPTGIFGLNSGVEYSYPEHPDRDDCINYLTTGFCSYGTRCGFNHPRDRASNYAPGQAASSSTRSKIGKIVEVVDTLTDYVSSIGS
ncbi:hypothetical protein RHMOL_Rhmol02G0050300 [Rhododendron molle]|uniref:Uncharacterized protein n=1 Tax=Rhododendron molle TaxID=49168 RepID=A0ACC0PM65_RHOML|nr:hypothetical protein RHMOL_Rhmol02G0050300 [Rhododendron molle]